VRYDRMALSGVHYRLNYLTPYWNPVGGVWLDVYAQGGMAELPDTVGVGLLSSQLSYVDALPDLSGAVADVPVLSALAPALRWLGESRLAVRGYGGTSFPGRGEFFTMGGGPLFRGFDLAQRQGSNVWVGSAEWRMPLATGLTWDVCDHVMGV